MHATVKSLPLVLLAVAVVGCKSKPAEEPVETAPVTSTPAVEETVETQPVDTATVGGTDLAEPQPVAAPLTADGFESNPANYTGDTNTKVIYFAFDRAEIPKAAYKTLKAHAKYLAENPTVDVKVGGHCDERGTPEYNVALGERRAQTVRDFLVMNGARSEQIKTVSFGEERPAELGHDELSWAKNRRAKLAYGDDRP
jgi:peptidoglycan-associated lipoprotein